MTSDRDHPGVTDSWAHGDLYEPYVGRWSRRVAEEFLSWLAVHPDARWLDVGCGTGALSETILRQASPRSVNGIDLSEGYVSLARQRIVDSRAAFHVGSAESLPYEEGRFEAAVSGLVLNFVPRPDLAVAEMRRVTSSGGTVAVYLWDYAGRMELMRYFWDAAVELDSAASDLDEGRRFPLCQPQPLQRLFETAGLREVEVRGIEVETPFRDFDDYWSPFLGGQGPAPGYAMSLPEARRDALRDHLRAKLPVNGDGSIRLTARAWSARGVK